VAKAVGAPPGHVRLSPRRSQRKVPVTADGDRDFCVSGVMRITAYDVGSMEDDSEPCIVSEHTARKSHKCASCPAEIKPGHRYTRYYFPPAAVYLEHADRSVCYFADSEPG